MFPECKPASQSTHKTPRRCTKCAVPSSSKLSGRNVYTGTHAQLKLKTHLGFVGIHISCHHAFSVNTFDEVTICDRFPRNKTQNYTASLAFNHVKRNIKLSLRRRRLFSKKWRQDVLSKTAQKMCCLHPHPADKQLHFIWTQRILFILI